MAYSNMSQNDKAEAELAPGAEAGAHQCGRQLQLGPAAGRSRADLPEAEQALRAALKADPQMAAAAFNLGVILGENKSGRGDCLVPEGARAAARRAEVRPHAGLLPAEEGRPRRRRGELLRKVIQDEPSYLDAYLLLGEIYEERHDFEAARQVYLDATKLGPLPPRMRSELEAKARALRSRHGGE